MDSAERTKYSSVYCWKSEWQNGKLKVVKINKEHSAYQKALDKLEVEKTWGNKNGR
jgi:hypothetical protein